MTDEKLIEVLNKYRDVLLERRCRPIEFTAEYYDSMVAPYTKQLNHALWMIDQCLLKHVIDNRDKALVWLGYIQCTLHDACLFTLNELRAHSRVS